MSPDWVLDDTEFHVDHLPPVTSSSIDAVRRGFVPTRRFSAVSFDSYRPDGRFPGQVATRDRLRDFAIRIGQQQWAYLLKRLIRSGSEEDPRAIYLDGGYSTSAP